MHHVRHSDVFFPYALKFYVVEVVFEAVFLSIDSVPCTPKLCYNKKLDWHKQESMFSIVLKLKVGK